MIQVDMQMPKNCADCCFASADLINGTITLLCMTPVGRKMYTPDLIGRTTRPEWCPLKESQPKKGHWIAEENYDDVIYRCSACDEEWVTIEGTPFDNGMWYCPHCGADMREGEHDA